MSRFLGKLVMVFLAGYMQVPLEGVLLFLVVGHLFDITYPNLKVKIENKYRSQRSSEKIIFLYAYSTYFLGLDYNTSVKSLANNTICHGADGDAVSSLLEFYMTRYIPTHLKSKLLNKKLDNKLQQAIRLLNSDITGEDTYLFIDLLEQALNSQELYTTDSQYDMLVKIASMIGINYVRNDNANQQNRTYEQGRNRTYHQNSYSDKNRSYQESYSENTEENYYYEHQEQSKTDYISDEVKQAYENFNLKPSRDYTFEEVKKIYKVHVKQYHPDILKGQGASDEELEKADDKLAELNKSIDIIKKFLANS